MEEREGCFSRLIGLVVPSLLFSLFFGGFLGVPFNILNDVFGWGLTELSCLLLSFFSFAAVFFLVFLFHKDFS